MGLEAGAPIHLTQNSPYHNHQPDATKGTKLVLMARLKERATQEVETRVSQILNEEAVRDPETVCNIAPPHARLAMKRARGAAQPAIPRTLEDMRNEMFQPGREHLRFTLDGLEQFVLDRPVTDDNGETLAEGFLSRRIIAHLARHPAEATQLMMDATFKIVPRRPEGLYQFFSIHVLYMDEVFPVAFFLMKRKTEEAYRRILQFMREQFWPIQTVTTDYEIALMNSVRAIFPNARRQGCWFHFCQNIWKHVVAEGLAALARQNADVRRVVKMVMALPHLPPHRGPPHDNRVPPYSIVDGLNAINNYIEEGHLDMRLFRIVDYVRRYWVGVVGVEVVSTFEAPRRTNNHLESFHAKLLSAFGVNLDVWAFVRRLQALEQEYYTNLRRVDGGEHHNHRIRRSRAEHNTNLIHRALGKLTRQEITVVNFLAQVGHCADNLMDVGLHVGGMEDGVEEEAVGIDWMLPVEAEVEVVAEELAAPQRIPHAA